MDQNRKAIVWGCAILAIGIALSGGVYEAHPIGNGPAIWTVNRFTGTTEPCGIRPNGSISDCSLFGEDWPDVPEMVWLTLICLLMILIGAYILRFGRFLGEVTGPMWAVAAILLGASVLIYNHMGIWQYAEERWWEDSPLVDESRLGPPLEYDPFPKEERSTNYFDRFDEK